MCRRTGSFECLYEFGDGKRNSGIIYHIIADFSQCAVYRFEFISEALPILQVQERLYRLPDLPIQ